MKSSQEIELPEECRKFIILFNAGKYFEAHEVLEALWLVEKGESRDFYQGMIQISALFVHLERGNKSGALQLYQKAAKNLLPYLPVYLKLPVETILKDVAAAIERGSIGYQLKTDEIKKGKQAFF